MTKGLGADIDMAIDAKRAQQRARDRFELIKAALGGICASRTCNMVNHDQAAEMAIKHADAVLAQLDAEKDK